MSCTCGRAEWDRLRPRLGRARLYVVGARRVKAVAMLYRLDDFIERNAALLGPAGVREYVRLYEDAIPHDYDHDHRRAAA